MPNETSFRKYFESVSIASWFLTKIHVDKEFFR